MLQAHSLDGYLKKNFLGFDSDMENNAQETLTKIIV